MAEIEVIRNIICFIAGGITSFLIIGVLSMNDGDGEVVVKDYE